MSLPVHEDLVYDVGMHNGDDTAYYLHKGCRVVAVEANPALLPPAAARFAAPIAAGRLVIENVAIAATPGPVVLHVSVDHDHLGSTRRENAARFGGAIATVEVPGMPFASLIERHGVPLYAKIDIEGSDRLCLDGLDPRTAPRYLSIEMDHVAGDADLARLAALGYTGFQCIRQNDLAAIGTGNLAAQLRLRRWRARGGPAGLAIAAARRIAREWHPARDGDWRFPRGASGRFGPGLPGPWMDLAAIRAVWQALHDIDRELGAGGVGEWFDIHARR